MPSLVEQRPPYKIEPSTFVPKEPSIQVFNSDGTVLVYHSENESGGSLSIRHRAQDLEKWGTLDLSEEDFELYQAWLALQSTTE